MRSAAMFAAVLLLLCSLAGLCRGQSCLAPTDLPELMLKGDLTMSETEYQLETGKYYRIHISSDGEEEFAWMSPELFRNSWVDQIVVKDQEIKGFGVYSLEFDDAGDLHR